MHVHFSYWKLVYSPRYVNTRQRQEIQQLEGKVRFDRDAGTTNEERLHGRGGHASWFSIFYVYELPQFGRRPT